MENQQEITQAKAQIDSISKPSSPTVASSLKIDDLKRSYFSPEDKDGAGKAIEQARAIAQAHNIPVAFNWPAEKNEPLPEGYGVAIVPTHQRREGQGNVVIGLHIAGVPSPTLILSDEEGQAWAGAALVNVLMNKYSNAVRPRDSAMSPPTAPFTVSDFITNVTRDSGLAFFREIQGQYVRALKLKGLKMMNSALLKQILASQQFSEQTFPKIAQTIWEGVLQRMINTAKEQNVEAGIVKTWLESRAQVEFDTVEFGLDDLDEIIGGQPSDASDGGSLQTATATA